MKYGIDTYKKDCYSVHVLHSLIEKTGAMVPSIDRIRKYAKKNNLISYYENHENKRIIVIPKSNLGKLLQGLGINATVEDIKNVELLRFYNNPEEMRDNQYIRNNFSRFINSSFD